MSFEIVKCKTFEDFILFSLLQNAKYIVYNRKVTQKTNQTSPAKIQRSTQQNWETNKTLNLVNWHVDESGILKWKSHRKLVNKVKQISKKGF